MLAYVAYADPPISREERVNGSRPVIFAHYDAQQQDFLDFVLDQYVEQGVAELDQDKLPDLLELKYHSISDAMEKLGRVQE